MSGRYKKEHPGRGYNWPWQHAKIDGVWHRRRANTNGAWQRLTVTVVKPPADRQRQGEKIAPPALNKWKWKTVK